MTEQAERRTLRQNLRELPGPAWFLVGGSFINRFASFAIVYLVLYLTDRGYSLARAGLVVAAYGVGEIIAAGLGGYMADRVGRRTTIAVSMFGNAVAMVALSSVDAYGAFVSIAFMAGVAAELYRPAGGALLADLVPEGRRVSAFAVLRFAVNLGFAAGSAVAGFLANESFLWLFWTDAATSVAYGLIALAFLPEGRTATRQEEVEHRGYLAILRDRAFLIFLVASILTAFVYFQQQVTLPLHVTDVAGLKRSDFGLLLALNGLLVVLLELPISSVTMRLPAKQMIALGFLLVGVGFGLTAVAESMPMLLLTVCIWTAGEMIGAPIGYAYVADIAPAHMRGRYQGLYGLAWGSGTVTGPAIGAWFFARGPFEFWIICGVIGLLSAALAMGTRARMVAPAPVAATAGPQIPASEAILVPDTEVEEAPR